MTENDYSIKPLPNLPNVSGLNPAKSSEDQKKRQRSRKRRSENRLDFDEPEDLKDNQNIKNNTDERHIDYCA